LLEDGREHSHVGATATLAAVQFEDAEQRRDPETRRRMRAGRSRGSRSSRSRLRPRQPKER